MASIAFCSRWPGRVCLFGFRPPLHHRDRLWAIGEVGKELDFQGEGAKQLPELLPEKSREIHVKCVVISSEDVWSVRKVSVLKCYCENTVGSDKASMVMTVSWGWQGSSQHFSIQKKGAQIRGPHFGLTLWRGFPRDFRQVTYFKYEVHVSKGFLIAPSFSSAMRLGRTWSFWKGHIHWAFRDAVWNDSFRFDFSQTVSDIASLRNVIFAYFCSSLRYLLLLRFLARDYEGWNSFRYQPLSAYIWLVVWNIWIIFPIFSIQLGISCHFIIPTDELTHNPSFFRGVGRKTTNQIIINHH